MFFSFSAPLLILILVQFSNLFRLSFLFASAHPASLSQPLLTIPIARPQTNADGKATHGSIVQQQHINRGLRRLALMTGKTPPSKAELAAALYERITHLSRDVLREYGLGMLEDFAQVSSPRALRSELNKGQSSSFQLLTRGDPAWPHSIGLTIESTDIGYIGAMKMGNPPRDFRLLIDSGSADLWVGAEGCTGDDGGGCGQHNFLGPRSSKSFNATKEDWAIGYVTGLVSGYLVQDDVCIAGLKLKSHKFGVATNESSDFTQDDIPFDGLLGFAKRDVSQQRIPSLLQSLYDAKLVHAPIASYRIPRLADGKNNGELTLGGMDHRQFDPRTLVTTKNVNKFGYWGVAVDAVSVGKKNMQWSNRTIVMDTGTTLLIAPPADVQAIHDSIPGAQYDGAGWTVPCNMTTTISLTVGGQVFPIDPRDIAFVPVDDASGYCMSGIGVGGVGPFYLDTDWLVGDVFLKNVYFSTDESRDEVSIAKPSH